MTTEPAAPMTVEQAMANILVRSEIKISTDRRGRQFAQYWDGRAHRWFRCNLAQAEVILAARA